MDWHVAGLRRLDGIIWTVVASIAVLVLLVGPLQGFTIVAGSFGPPAGTCLLLLGAATYYSRRRDDPRLASALGSTAQMIAFAAVGAPLSYVAAASTGAWPLQDPTFSTLDHTLMFDWQGLLAAMQAWPLFHTTMRLVYLSLSVQMTIVVLVLGFTGRLAWLRVYTLAFLFAALLCIGISMLMPAEGVWLFDHLKAVDANVLPISHGAWPVYAGLRDGSYRLLMAVGAEGIITFPSLHAGLAVILVAALWPVPLLRWVGLTVNVLMVLATPIDGSHYLTDILAGILVAVVSLAAARALVARLAVLPDTTAEPGATPEIAAPAR